MTEKTSTVTAICIIAIALGILGVLGGAMGVFTLVSPPKAAAPSKDPKLALLNVEFQRRIEESQRDLRPFSLVLVPIMLTLSTMLVVAGVGGLKLRRLGFFRFTLCANALVDVFGGALGIVAQFRTIGATSWYFRETASVSSLPAGFATAMQFAATSGVAASLVLLLGKLAFYVWGTVQLGKLPGSEGPAPQEPGSP